MSPTPPPYPVELRLPHIEQARRSVLREGQSGAPHLAPWLGRSWQRCLNRGQVPERKLTFEAVSAAGVARSLELNRALLQAARPVMATLAQAVAETRHFALLTDARGMVIDFNGPIDRQDRRATALARLGVDLSEEAVGTTAIGAALAELQPVWLHRGEHFFDDTAMYSCAGAPVFGPHGSCVGMLDLTGIDTPERPALRHLVTRSAQRIENTLVRECPHTLLLRLSWPGQTPGGEADGLLAVDKDAAVVGFNPAAADMLGLLPGTEARPHLEQLVATRPGTLFDLAHRPHPPEVLPLWSGLCLQVQAEGPERAQAWANKAAAPAQNVPLRDVEASLIRRAIDTHRGNVAAAAKALGISRATLYRRLRGKN